MLAIDSLVIDLIFTANAEIDPRAVLDALGGEEIASARQIVDPDMQDPRWELELTPSMPFRRRDERRLLIIDSSMAPLRADPRENSVAEIDFRPEKERLLKLCESLNVRAARLMGLGVWGSAVIATRNAVDLRALCLISWALDPSTDMQGRRRANPLGREEFEEKLMAYEKRLEELDEKQILENLGPAKLERRGDFMVVDVLDGKGHWDLIHSLEMEAAIGATHRFSVIVGAPQGKSASSPQSEKPKPTAKPAASQAAPAGAPVKPPLRVIEHQGEMVIVFPRDRFDLEIAAAIGKKDWEAVIKSGDLLTGEQRDTLHEKGGGFIAPLEFLSEVFVDGTPLTRSVFEAKSMRQGDDSQTLDVHCPRFGQVHLIAFKDRSRFISSVAIDSSIKETIRESYPN